MVGKEIELQNNLVLWAKSRTLVIEESLGWHAVEHCLRLLGFSAMQPHRRGNQKTDGANKEVGECQNTLK